MDTKKKIMTKYQDNHQDMHVTVCTPHASTQNNTLGWLKKGSG